MFGSLVVVFPTPHEGGALLLRHKGEEWTFDSAATLTAALPSSIAYVALFSDVEHEVLPVTSGHRVTLTYSLYFDEHERVSAKDLVSELPSIPQEDNERIFCRTLNTLLKDPKFLLEGGTLGFGLRHMYQLNDNLDHAYGLLKGSDAVVYQTMRALGFEPVLYLRYMGDGDGVLLDKLPEIEYGEFEDPYDLLREEGGIYGLVRRSHSDVGHASDDIQPSENRVCWAWERTMFGLGDGDVCLIVRVGKP
jgi:hypothetical protein